MKKFALFLIAVLVICIFSILNVGKVSADNSQVKVIMSCNLYSNPKLIYEEGEEGILATLSFGEVLNVVGEAGGEDTDFDFYYVSYQSDTLKYGYVIKNFVMNAKINSLERMLDPNAKTLNKANIFISKDGINKFLIGGEEVTLNQYEPIKIIEVFDSSKVFHKIMFEIEGVIYTGFIKTSDLLVEGYSATTIFIIFILILVLSIIWSIYWTTRKKRKKQARK